jgi:antitoxin HicB
MRYVYPVVLTPDPDGGYVATARDVPEAITHGDAIDEALIEMSDALGAALAGYSLEGREIPVPSEPETGERLVPVAPLVAAKLSLRNAMREQGVSNVALAERLGISEGAVRRLVNPDHMSKLDGVVAALAVLGRGIIIEDQDRAAA